jgi:biopolymer transport protein ExbD
LASKSQNLDVWVIDTNTVYSKVPYTVVADWIQQGRILDSDRVKPSGTPSWQNFADVPTFAPYFPKSAPFQADDHAEALEPVEIGFTWKPPQPDEDEDVDMIPLIDVSLVLLIFFMMTAAVSSASSLIKTPQAFEGTGLTRDENMLWIGIDRASDNSVFYSIGHGNSIPAEGDRLYVDDPPSAPNAKSGLQKVLERFDGMLRQGPVEVRIKANRDLPYDLIKKLTVALERRKSPSRSWKVFAEVSEAERP